MWKVALLIWNACSQYSTQRSVYTPVRCFLFMIILELSNIHIFAAVDQPIWCSRFMSVSTPSMFVSKWQISMTMQQRTVNGRGGAGGRGTE